MALALALRVSGGPVSQPDDLPPAATGGQAGWAGTLSPSKEREVEKPTSDILVYWVYKCLLETLLSILLSTYPEVE